MAIDANAGRGLTHARPSRRNPLHPPPAKRLAAPASPTPNQLPPQRRASLVFTAPCELNSARVGRDAGRIAEEVIPHLAGQMGAEVTVTIEIEARLPNGASEQLDRTVTENSRTLKFDSQGFEKE